MSDENQIPIDPEEEYKSSEDEDFNPDGLEAAQDEDLSSSEDEEALQPKTKKAPKKRKKAQVDAEEELDSGDEATITELRKSKKRKTDDDEDSGGEGGLIKTRAQRKAEKQERQEYQRANVEDVTVDVDALWASMTAKPIGRPTHDQPRPQEDNTQHSSGADKPHAQPSQPDEDDNGMITIKRSYDFAGQKVTEEKRVHKDSAEAKLYLANNDTSKQTTAKPSSPSPTSDQPTLRRPLRRASKFEPNPTGEVKGLPADRQRLRTPSRADVLAQQNRLEEEAKKGGKAVKLNTVQKSAIDWAAHVDEEGLKDELDEYGRSKQGYIGKMDFLRGVHGKKEEEERKARMAKSTA
ncbi:BCNT-domain-containing protein [Aureobasidium pullulans]|uniref:SWR1-complex protein 5 n=1 Tax=Aureobasidium pullulans TaxID=5580 RepID=A0A4S9X9V1_AURPU|nr:BCNT-domain-containing protein [Aureobasidium pullulans]